MHLLQGGVAAPEKTARKRRKRRIWRSSTSRCGRSGISGEWCFPLPSLPPSPCFALPRAAIAPAARGVIALVFVPAPRCAGGRRGRTQRGGRGEAQWSGGEAGERNETKRKETSAGADGRPGRRLYTFAEDTLGACPSRGGACEALRSLTPARRPRRSHLPTRGDARRAKVPGDGPADDRHRRPSKR